MLTSEILIFLHNIFLVIDEMKKKNDFKKYKLIGAHIVEHPV